MNFCAGRKAINLTLLLLLQNKVFLFLPGGKCIDGPGPADGYDERECPSSPGNDKNACYSEDCNGDGVINGWRGNFLINS